MSGKCFDFDLLESCASLDICSGVAFYIYTKTLTLVTAKDDLSDLILKVIVKLKLKTLTLSYVMFG